MVVGSMLEKLTGKAWDKLMQERIFGPLQMESAGYGPTGTNDDIDQPWGHFKPFRSKYWTATQFDNPETMGPAGTVHCNLEDWGKFISFQFLQNDTTQLSKVQRDKLLEVNQNNYASGWGITESNWAKGKVYRHTGSNTYNYARVLVAPNIGRAFVVCTNSFDSESHKICKPLFRALSKLESE